MANSKHTSSLWKVLGLYAAGSWVVLQVVDVLAQNAGLPQWVFTLALILLGVPLVRSQETGPLVAGGEAIRLQACRLRRRSSRKSAATVFAGADVPGRVRRECVSTRPSLAGRYFPPKHEICSNRPYSPKM